MGSESPSAQYIHMVQHLIEECIVFKMSKEECMEALHTHANINPVITSTVWKELEKENKEFFETYAKKREEKAAAGAASACGIERERESTESSQRKRILDIVSDSTRKHSDEDEK